MIRSDPPRLAEFRCAETIAVPSRERLEELHDRIVAEPRRGGASRFLPALAAAIVIAGSFTVLGKTFLFRPAARGPEETPAAGSAQLERERRRHHGHAKPPARAEVEVGNEALVPAPTLVSVPAPAPEPPAAVGTPEPAGGKMHPRGNEPVTRADDVRGSVPRSYGAPRRVDAAPLGRAPAIARELGDVSTIAMSDRGAPAERPSEPDRGSIPAPFHPAPLSASAVLRGALEQLRGGRNPGAALGLIDAHRAELASGSLAAEGDLVRLEALLALGRRDQAAHLLDAMELPPSRRDLHLLRGELRAGQGRCPDALADFEAARRLQVADEVDERALHGLAACHSKLGERAQARATLEAYLRGYPAGAFADEARRALGD